jgi:hypothetical protein
MDAALLQSVARQLMSGTRIEIEGQIAQIQRTSAQRLRTAKFRMNGRDFQAIEQNATKPSRWGQLAREGHQVVQFKDLERNSFVAVSVDGEVTEYKR